MISWKKLRGETGAIEIPAGTKTIPSGGLFRCPSHTITLPSTLQKIESSAFECAYLEKVDIPDSVTRIGNMAFQNCSLLSSVMLPKGLKSIGYFAFAGCKSLKEVVFPESVNLKKIAEKLFYECGIEEIIIPEGVEEIGADAFRRCAWLKRVVLPNSLKKIGHGAFAECPNLHDIRIPKNVEVIENQTFYHSALCQVDLPEGLKYIGAEAFDSTEIASLKIPDTVTDIFGGAFYNCKFLESIKMPNDLKIISEDMFSNCIKLKKIELPKGVSIIKREAFLNSGITNIQFPELLKTIERRAFSKTQLTRVVLPASVQNIGDAIFLNCPLLEEIEISEGIETIPSAFAQYCEKLSSVKLPSSLIEINPKAFKNCFQLKKIAFPKKLEKIGNEAFMNCSFLSTVEGFEKTKVKHIQGKAFYNCNLLKQVQLPDTLKTICAEAFYNTSVNFEIPSSVTMIGDKAFYRCDFRKMTIPERANKIGSEFILDCKSLEQITIPLKTLKAFKTWKSVTNDIKEVVLDGITLKKSGNRFDVKKEIFTGTPLEEFADTLVAISLFSNGNDFLKALSSYVNTDE